MLQEREAFFRGLAIMRELTGRQHVTIAVKQKNQDVVDGFRARPKRPASSCSSTPMSIRPATNTCWSTRSPAGRSRRAGSRWPSAAWWTTSRRSSTSLTPCDGQPVTDKYVTVTGAVHKPLTTVVPVGTSIRECLQLAGGCTVDDPVVLTGGVMMGGVAQDLSDPVAKNMGGLIALPAGSLPGPAKDGRQGNLHADRARPVRSVLAVHRALPAVHPGLSDPAAPRDADAADDGRGESPGQPVGPVLLRVQHLFVDRLPGTARPEEHLRGRQGPAAAEQAGADARRNWNSCSCRRIRPARDARSPSRRCTRGWG